MLNLIRNLNMIIGTSIDEKDECWNLLLALQEIMQIICSPNITIDTPEFLEIKIAEYLTSLNEKFTNAMKPKHHFMLHYPSIMRQVGPLWNISCMRFESKHQEAKKISHSAICRINVCRTIALKHRLIFNYRLFSKNSNYPPLLVNNIKKVHLNSIPDALNIAKLLPHDFLNENVHITNCIQILEKTIKENSVVVNFSEFGEQFSVVKHIILNEEKEFVLIVKQLNDVYLNEHIRAYKIYNGENNHYKVLRKIDLQSAVMSYTNKLSDGFFYIAKLWA